MTCDRSARRKGDIGEPVYWKLIVCRQLDLLGDGSNTAGRTHRILETPMRGIQLDGQTRFPFPRLLEKGPGEPVVVVPRCAGHVDAKPSTFNFPSERPTAPRRRTRTFDRAFLALVGVVCEGYAKDETKYNSNSDHGGIGRIKDLRPGPAAQPARRVSLPTHPPHPVNTDHPGRHSSSTFDHEQLKLPGCE